MIAEEITKATNDKRYEIWTYHGGIPQAVVEQANGKLGEGASLAISESDQERAVEIDGVIVLTGNGKILSVNLNPLSDEFPYSVYNCEPDVACLLACLALAFPICAVMHKRF
ncbi:MAG: hypothetical protein Q4A60_06265 [Pasteurellaceae bacterium]|nr:hypothetical protein [Pasteurellaceae bacterium]